MKTVDINLSSYGFPTVGNVKPKITSLKNQPMEESVLFAVGMDFGFSVG